MGGWVKWTVAAVFLLGAPALAHDAKRTDLCGCHHQWGLRHCHPKKKTQRCEAPVDDRTGEKQQQQKRQLPPPSATAIRI